MSQRHCQACTTIMLAKKDMIILVSILNYSRLVVWEREVGETVDCTTNLVMKNGGMVTSHVQPHAADLSNCPSVVQM